MVSKIKARCCIDNFLHYTFRHFGATTANTKRQKLSRAKQFYNKKINHEYNIMHAAELGTTTFVSILQFS